MYVVFSVPESENGIITVDDTGEPPVVTPPTAPLHPNLVWPTPSGILEDEARRICEAPILQSPAYAVCRNFALQSLDVITESCMLDLQVYTAAFFCLSGFLLQPAGYCSSDFLVVRRRA